VAGENAISTFQSSSYGKRAFCSQCGAVTPVLEQETGVVFCPAGNIHGELGHGEPGIRQTPHQRFLRDELAV
jgi:hypothetical protein